MVLAAALCLLVFPQLFSLVERLLLRTFFPLALPLSALCLCSRNLVLQVCPLLCLLLYANSSPCSFLLDVFVSPSLQVRFRLVTLLPLHLCFWFLFHAFCPLCVFFACSWMRTPLVIHLCYLSVSPVLVPLCCCSKLCSAVRLWGIVLRRQLVYQTCVFPLILLYLLPPLIVS